MKFSPNLRFQGFDTEWKLTFFKNIGEFKKSYTYSRATEGEGITAHIHYGDIHSKYQGKVYGHQAPTINVEAKHEYVQNGDLIFADASEDYSDLGKCVVVEDVEDKKVISGLHTHRFSTKSYIIPAFIMYYTKTTPYSRYIRRVGTGISVLGLSKSNLGELQLALPTTEEQQKIADFFSLLDRRIEKQEAKVEALRKKKKGLLQKIFTQELRFKDIDGNNFPYWTQRKLKEIVKIELRPVSKPSDSYIRLGLRSHAKGTFHTLVDKPEDVGMDTLYLVKENDLIVNITFAWEHAIAIAKKEDENKLVSHRFPTYTFNQNECPEFFNQRLKLNDIKYLLGNASPGGAGRNRVLNKKDFLNIKFEVPIFKEQQKIADFLSAFDHKIEKEAEKLKALKEQKRSFIQQMFV